MEKTSEHRSLEELGYSFELFDPGMPNEAFVHVSFGGSRIGSSHGLDRSSVLRDSLRIANEHQGSYVKSDAEVTEDADFSDPPSQPDSPNTQIGKTLIFLIFLAAVLILLFIAFSL